MKTCPIKKIYKVDLDYEAFLFDPQYKEGSPTNQKIIREFEYVFFLVNQEKAILKNCQVYDQSYLARLKNMEFVIPEFNPEALTFEYWWGQHLNIELERTLNSKLTSAQIAILNHWGFKQGAVVETWDELKNHLKKFPKIEKWIIKRPDSFSGIGHKQFRTDALDESLLSKILEGKVLLEPIYERVFDIGTTFEVVDGIIKRQFMVENFNSESGSFKGGAGSSDVDKFKKYIFKKYSYSLDELEKTTQQIAQTYLNLGAVSNIQIDSFIYRENGELKTYALVEVNYRKTMGLVIQSLASKYPEADWVEWRIESVKKVKKNPLNSEWIRLSPDRNHLQSFLKINFA
ncbi:MAG: hypothetical protein PHY93_02590 [Bacteriovorax sp.]|nr:hypothetical protein [Bacteriovorax sp.]